MKVLILYSGGADSVLMHHLATKMAHDVTLLAFRYGQVHEEEIEYAQQAAGGQLEILDVGPIFEQVSSRLLGQSVEYPGVHEMHVPGRNGIFITIALGIAEHRGLDEVWIGCDFSDRLNLFPDCYQEWIVRMDEIGQRNGSSPIRVKAPLLGLEKTDVVRLLEAEGIDMKEVYSGYAPPSASRFDAEEDIPEVPLPPRSTLPPGEYVGVTRDGKRYRFQLQRTGQVKVVLGHPVRCEADPDQ